MRGLSAAASSSISTCRRGRAGWFSSAAGWGRGAAATARKNADRSDKQQRRIRNPFLPSLLVALSARHPPQQLAARHLSSLVKSSSLRCHHDGRRCVACGRPPATSSIAIASSPRWRRPPSSLLVRAASCFGAWCARHMTLPQHRHNSFTAGLRLLSCAPGAFVRTIPRHADARGA